MSEAETREDEELDTSREAVKERVRESIEESREWFEYLSDH